MWFAFIVDSCLCLYCFFFFFKQKTAYEMRISDWSSTCALPILLGEIIAKVSGQSYEDYISTNILEPMGIHRALLTGARRTYAADESRCYLPEIGRASCRERVCQYV